MWETKSVILDAPRDDVLKDWNITQAIEQEAKNGWEVVSVVPAIYVFFSSSYGHLKTAFLLFKRRKTVSEDL